MRTSCTKMRIRAQTNLLIFCIAVHPLFAATDEAIDEPSSKEIICRGICLLGKDETLLPTEVLTEQQGIVFRNLKRESREESFAKTLENHFLDRVIDEGLVLELHQAIEKFYEEQRHSLAEIVIPEQEITDGILQVHVLESRLASVLIEGGKHSSAERLKNYLGIEQEEVIDFINRNLFRRVDLVYSPGPEKQTTNISLVVEDRRAVRVYTGSDNSSVPTTGRSRWFSGIDCANFLGTDSFFAYQYTASYDLHQFQAHTMQCITFLPWRNILNVYGGYSTLHANLAAPAKKNHGQSAQASGRYVFPLLPQKFLEHEAGFGFDFKRTNNTIEFEDILPAIGPPVNLSQFTLRYAGHLTYCDSRIDLETELFLSPGAILGDESNELYQKLRPHAQNHWVYWKALLRYFQKLPHSFYLSTLLHGQISSQNLLPSEQIGLGGFNSVRGYDERQLNYDSGCILNVELLSPAFPIFQRLPGKKSWKDAMQILEFIDVGVGGNHTLISPEGEKKYDYLLGIGSGVRYTVDPWITARLDCAMKLHREELFTGGDVMWYFSLTGNL